MIGKPPGDPRPDSPLDKAARVAFADFLERLVDRPRPPADWFDFVATHYADSGLEQLRREFASRSAELCADELTQPTQDEVWRWIERLRASVT